MAAMKRKFTLPPVEDLDEGMQIPRTKSLFKASKTSGENGRAWPEDMASRNTKRNGDICRDTGVQSTSLSKQNADVETLLKTKVVIKQSLSHETKDSATNENCSNKHPSSEDIDDPMSLAVSGGVKPVVGKTFRETFAFLEGTSHYKETVAKIKDKELTKPEREAVPSTSSKPKTNAIIVNPRQKGNPVLKYVRSVPWELGDIIPDYEVGVTTCVLFLSLKYHNHYPEYIHKRLKHLGQRYELRILLVLVDVPDPHQTLRELAKMAVMADCTLILSWSSEEAGRYLETYKVYENKPPDALMGQSEGDYFTKLTECLTTIKGINKTDCVSLSSTFGCLSNMAKASKEDLAFLPGFGPLKAQRLHDLFHEPFVAKKKEDLSKDIAGRSTSNNGL